MSIKTGVRAGLLTIVGTAAVVLGLAAPAAAHVEVSADKTQAGATIVTVTFSAESERDNAGISAVEVVRPTGLPAGSVTAGELPSGWALTTTSTGVRVSGKALAAGMDADFSLKLSQLPTDQSALVLKTLVSYSDGAVDRWIEIPVAGQPEPPYPAPIIELTGAVSPAPSPSVATPSTAPTTGAASSSPAAAPETDKDGGNTGLWVGVGAAVLLGAGGVLYAMRRNRS